MANIQMSLLYDSHRIYGRHVTGQYQSVRSHDNRSNNLKPFLIHNY